MNTSLLIIGHTLPEPTTTAAGSRMMQLIDVFIEYGYQITFVSTALSSERSADLKSLQIDVVSITLNDASFDVFISEINPAIVLFDRFITEEQFGWRVAEICPDALRILDTEDLHFLRKARQKAVKNHLSYKDADVFSETAKREIASIYRCDLSLIISEVEINLLVNTFKIPSDLLMYLPFLISQNTSEERKKLPKFSERTEFITIGNHLHAPNVDAVLQLKKNIWPLIKEKLPQATLQVYGAYAPQQITQLHDEANHFLINGWTPSVSEVFKTAKVLLAPLRFGAGLKGKVVDAMQYGVPIVTSELGAEGIAGDFAFPGFIEDEAGAFAEKAVILFTSEADWSQAQGNGFKIIDNRFRRKYFSETFHEVLKKKLANLKQIRTENFVGQMLRHHTLQSTKFMSKWIEEKNK